ncbi:MAG: hypothetical protein J5I93_25360 [Pirellulaceae bacterium]|nr:hypothetical protein [Pirellulaceae bacterium]
MKRLICLGLLALSLAALPLGERRLPASETAHPAAGGRPLLYHPAHGPRRPARPPVPHYQKHAPNWRFYGYHPQYEGGFHARHLQDIGYPDAEINWVRGRAW